MKNSAFLCLKDEASYKELKNYTISYYTYIINENVAICVYCVYLLNVHKSKAKEKRIKQKILIQPFQWTSLLKITISFKWNTQNYMYRKEDGLLKSKPDYY